MPLFLAAILMIHLDSSSSVVELWRIGVVDELICAAPCDRSIEVRAEDECGLGWRF